MTRPGDITKRCDTLEEKIYSNCDIAGKISDDFIPVRVDLTRKLSDREMALGKQYNLRNECLLLFIDHKGNIIKGPGEKSLCFTEAMKPGQFIQYLDLIEEGYKSHKY